MPVDQISINEHEKRTGHLKDFTVSADYIEIKNIDEYLNLSRNLKKSRNMKRMMIPIVVGALGTVP